MWTAITSYNALDFFHGLDDVVGVFANLLPIYVDRALASSHLGQVIDVFAGLQHAGKVPCRYGQKHHFDRQLSNKQHTTVMLPNRHLEN